MKLSSIVIITFLILFASCKKETHPKKKPYSSVILKAERLSNDQDSLKQLEALSIYEKAFKKFPDSIDDYSIYNVTYIASKFKKKDIAFKYLKPLSELIEDEDGYPGWDYILGEYSDEDYKNLKNDSRWETLKKGAIINKKLYFETLKKNEEEFFKTKPINYNDSNPAKLYTHLKSKTPYLNKLKQNYSIVLKINDTLNTSYFVHLPEHYSSDKSYPLLVVLHGAVRGSELSNYTTKLNLKYFHRFYTKYAKKHNVILAFPIGSRDYNWMTSNKGFFIVPKMVKQLKSAIHINDNKVFVTGHSNGATGAFSYLMKQPNQFAGFYGFNTKPKVFTGGTFLENITNRSFINISTDQDYYYHPDANDSLNKIMKDLKTDYQDHRFNGFPHWFPQFDESESAHQILFSDLIVRKRNPFPKTINWEFDDNRYGCVDWLSNTILDTTINKKKWHKNINFKISKQLKLAKKNSDSLVEVNVDEKAFDFPRKSGKIIAIFNNNIFNIETSRVKSFQINISPEMVNLSKPVKVFVNNKLVFDASLNFDRDYIIENWKKNKDRSQLWVNHIDVVLK